MCLLLPVSTLMSGSKDFEKDYSVKTDYCVKTETSCNTPKIYYTVFACISHLRLVLPEIPRKSYWGPDSVSMGHFVGSTTAGPRV